MGRYAVDGSRGKQVNPEPSPRNKKGGTHRSIKLNHAECAELPPEGDLRGFIRSASPLGTEMPGKDQWGGFPFQIISLYFDLFFFLPCTHMVFFFIKKYGGEK